MTLSSPITQALRATALPGVLLPPDIHTLAQTMRHDACGHLRGVVELSKVMEKRLNGEKDLEIMGLIRRGGEEVTRLINGITRYAEICVTSPDRRMCEADAICAELLEDGRDRFSDHCFDIQHDTKVTVFADKRMFTEAMKYVVDNAFLYHPDGAQEADVHIHAEDTPENTVFTVSDNGIGMHLDNAERAMRLLGRLQTHTAFPGAGTGLANAEMIMQKHGGSIAFVAPAEGYTTAVRLSWPKA